MKRKKIFGIQRKNFMYGDDYHYHEGDAPEFTYLSFDRKKVESVSNDLEILMCKKGGPLGLALENYFGDNDQHVWKSRNNAMKEVTQLFKQYFNMDIELNEHGNIPNGWNILRIPNDASDEHVNEVRKLLQLNFFSIYEVDANEGQMSFEVKYNNEFFPKTFLDYDGNEKDYYYYLKIPGKFLTEETALHHAAYNYYEFFAEWDHTEVRYQKIPGFIGTLEQLSNTPKILESTLKSMEQFAYNSVDKLITIKTDYLDYIAFPKEFTIINDLLKIKPFEIIKTPLNPVQLNHEEFDSAVIASKILNSMHIREIPM